jgi:hypothetical protein
MTLVRRLIEILGGRASPGAALPLLEGTVVMDEGSDPPGPEPFLLSVDDAGQFLVVPGERVSLGHLRSGVADLLFLADVGPVHAHLERTESLSEGPAWSLHPVAGERSFLNDDALTEATRLTPGDEVRLGENLCFGILRPDAASHTICLELRRGADCSGAKVVVLFGAGDGGRLRIGAAANRHVRVAGLEHEITLVHREGRLYIQCDAGVQGAAAAGEEGVSLPCPPPQRFDLSIGKPEGSRPPFGLAFEPSDLAAHRAHRRQV